MEQENQITHEQMKVYQLAGFWVRFYAFLIDLILIGTLNIWVMKPLFKRLELDGFISNWIQFSMLSLGLVGFLYFVIMTRVWSQSLGKMIMGIRVIRKDGKPLDSLTVLFREVVGRTISQLFGLHLGYIWVMFSKQKEGWHDKIGETYVVYEDGLTESQFVQIPTNQDA